MGKRIKYKIGDVFMVPLDDYGKGAGRVLKINEATVFIELYQIKPIKSNSEFNFKDAIEKKPLVMHWSYDNALRSGEWEIIEYQPIDNEIEMPYFWQQDAGDLKYYIRRGSSDSFRTSGERIEISKDDIGKYEPAGIGNEISEKKRYIKRLIEACLI